MSLTILRVGLGAGPGTCTQPNYAKGKSVIKIKVVVNKEFCNIVLLHFIKEEFFMIFFLLLSKSLVKEKRLKNRVNSQGECAYFFI